MLVGELFGVLDGNFDNESFGESEGVMLGVPDEETVGITSDVLIRALVGGLLDALIIGDLVVKLAGKLEGSLLTNSNVGDLVVDRSLLIIDVLTGVKCGVNLIVGKQVDEGLQVLVSVTELIDDGKSDGVVLSV